MGHLIIFISFTRREVDSDGGAMGADVIGRSSLTPRRLGHGDDRDLRSRI